MDIVSPQNKFDFQLQLLLLGDSGVGKTCCMKRYTNDTFTSTGITNCSIDFNIKNIQINGCRIKLKIWDTAGQERFRTITTSYFRGAQGFLIIYDVTDRNSFNSVRNWISQIEMHGDLTAPRIIIGQKCDVSEHRVISVDEGQALATEYCLDFFEVSARTDYNCERAFIHIVTMSCENLGFFVAKTVTTASHSTGNSPRKPLLYGIEQSKFQQHWSAVSWKSGQCCYLCDVVFGPLFRRRHHCRVCGELVCKNHSLSRKLLPAFGYMAVPQRICDYCAGKREAVNIVTAKKKQITFHRDPDVDARAGQHTYEKSVDVVKGIEGFTLQHECHHDGGTSVLHLGTFASQPCLVKQYKPWIAEAGQQQIICREVILLQQISHPNVMTSLLTNFSRVLHLSTTLHCQFILT